MASPTSSAGQLHGFHSFISDLDEEWPIQVHYSLVRLTGNIKFDGDKIFSVNRDGDIPALEGTTLNRTIPFLIRADRVVSWRQFHAALGQALAWGESGRPKSRTFKAEVIVRMSNLWSITDSLNFFTPSTGGCSAVMLAIVAPIDDKHTADFLGKTAIKIVMEDLGGIEFQENIEWLNVSHDDDCQLKSFTDIGAIRAHYKIHNDAELELSGGLEAAVILRIAAKGV